MQQSSELVRSAIVVHLQRLVLPPSRSRVHLPWPTDGQPPSRGTHICGREGQVREAPRARRRCAAVTGLSCQRAASIVLCWSHSVSTHTRDEERDRCWRRRGRRTTTPSCVTSSPRASPAATAASGPRRARRPAAPGHGCRRRRRRARAASRCAGCTVALPAFRSKASVSVKLLVQTPLRSMT